MVSIVKRLQLLSMVKADEIWDPDTWPNRQLVMCFRGSPRSITPDPLHKAPPLLKGYTAGRQKRQKQHIGVHLKMIDSTVPLKSSLGCREGSDWTGEQLYPPGLGRQPTLRPRPAVSESVPKRLRASTSSQGL